MFNLDFFAASKIQNRLVKSRNGNGIKKGNLKVLHWNLGARLWKNKLVDLELLLEEHRPDLCFITEANLWQDHLVHERERSLDIN